MESSINKQQYTDYLALTNEIGKVLKIVPPFIYVDGLPGCKLDELVVVDNGQKGYITTVNSDYIEILLLDKEMPPIGSFVTRTGERFYVEVGNYFLGDLITPMGTSMIDKVHLGEAQKLEVDVRPKDIHERTRITESFETGVQSVDLLVPLGRGQRELVIGDRKTGKTEFILQAMLHQARGGTVCIYTCIGKKHTEVAKVVEFCRANGILENCIIVSSFASDAHGMIHLTPYSAMTIAEYFLGQGRDVFLVLDDLTYHAKIYREISLIARSFPGREAYPGDIFYLHSRLLERAGRFVIKGEKRSLTCLPVVQTIGGDISGYIQTNLMSITDGHLYFDAEIFKSGIRPPINHNLSVTRVGRQTQDSLRWSINRELTSFLTLYEKTESYIHFGAEINESIRSTLRTGQLMTKFLNQHSGVVFPINAQVLLFSIFWLGLVTEEMANDYMQKFLELYTTKPDFKELCDGLVTSVANLNELLAKISTVKDKFISL